nr:divergent serine/threonine protein kinase [Cedratvirus lena]
MEFRGINPSAVRQYLGSCLTERIKGRKTTGYLKYKLDHDLVLYQNEIKAYSKLTDLDVCPKLLHHEVVFDCKVSYKLLGSTLEEDKGEFTLYGYYLEVERYGVDLVEKFGKASSSSVYCMNKDRPFNKQELALCFPYPQHIQTQIIDLVEKMYKAGVYHKDLHSGNVLIKDEVVKIIDFEFCEFDSI